VYSLRGCSGAGPSIRARPVRQGMMLGGWKLMVFMGASAGIVFVSRGSLRRPLTHGFYRFFAWEAVAALICLNVEHWFRKPLSIHQMVSWLLLMVSLFLAVHGIRLLRVAGRPDHTRADSTLLGMYKTTRLVTAGAYKYIRHPLYSSLLFLAWGVFFKAPSWPGAGLAGAATLSLIMTGRVEEAENIRFFGPAYEGYMRESKMFIPFVF
jgi:protein-S-isoprenylcysteine O-methyltransferase Ste14